MKVCSRSFRQSGEIVQPRKEKSTYVDDVQECVDTLYKSGSLGSPNTVSDWQRRIITVGKPLNSVTADDDESSYEHSTVGLRV